MAKGKTLVREAAPSGVQKAPGGGFVADDGRMTPAARKTQAQIDRERLIAEDVLKLTPFENTEGREIFVARWGRNERILLRETADRQRNGEGEFVLSETDLSNDEKYSVIVLIHGLRDADGEAYFDVDQILAYRQHSEDSELLEELLRQIMRANPKVFGKDLVVVTPEPPETDSPEPEKKNNVAERDYFVDYARDLGEHIPLTIRQKSFVAYHLDKCDGKGRCLAFYHGEAWAIQELSDIAMIEYFWSLFRCAEFKSREAD